MTGEATSGGVLVVYVAFIGYLVVRLARRPVADASEYLLAGRRLTLPAFVATLVVSWYGGILGVGEYGYSYGVSNWLVFGVPYYVAAILFAVCFATRARRSPFVSVPDALARTYGRPAGRLGGLVIFLMTAPATYVLMLGALFGFAFGWPAWVGVVGGAALSVAYVFRGGLPAVVRTDVVQFVLMYGAFAAAVIYLVVTRGVDPLRSLPDTHFTWHGGNSPQYILSWFFIALATLIEPAFYQRVFAAESPATARRGVFVSLGFWVVFDAMSTTAALYAAALLPGLADPVTAFPALADAAFPAGLAALFFVGMLATVMSTVDTNAFLAANAIGNVFSSDDEVSDAAITRSRWGLIAAGAWAVGLALVSDSVVDLWHDLGSIGTPGLLLPLAGSFLPWLRVRRGAVGWIVAPMIVAGVWRFVGPWGGVEPIYAGLATSVALRFALR